MFSYKLCSKCLLFAATHSQPLSPLIHSNVSNVRLEICADWLQVALWSKILWRTVWYHQAINLSSIHSYFHWYKVKKSPKKRQNYSRKQSGTIFMAHGVLLLWLCYYYNCYYIICVFHACCCCEFPCSVSCTPIKSAYCFNAAVVIVILQYYWSGF